MTIDDLFKNIKLDDIQSGKVRQILDAISDRVDEMLIMLTATGEVVYSNYNENRALPMTFMEIIERAKREIILMQVLNETSRTSYVGRCRSALTPDCPDHERLLEMRLIFHYSIFKIDGKVYYILCIRNTTELLVAEQKLLELNYALNEKANLIQESQLKLLNQDKLVAIGHLAAGIAHEINNPLGFVKSNVEMLTKYLDDFVAFQGNINRLIMGLNQLNAKIQNPELLDIIRQFKALSDDDLLKYAKDDAGDLITDTENGFERIERIVKSLRNFSRIDDTQNIQEYDINTGLLETLVLINNEVQAHSELILDTQFVPLTLAYSGEVNQVLLNLLVNAIDAIKERHQNRKGIIKITTRSDEHFIYLTIMDNGIGIRNEHQERVYNPFFTTKEVGKGTGLGLSIAYDVISNKHHGELKFETAFGEGTTFYIKLPIKRVNSAIVDEFMNYL